MVFMNFIFKNCIIIDKNIDYLNGTLRFTRKLKKKFSYHLLFFNHLIRKQEMPF